MWHGSDGPYQIGPGSGLEEIGLGASSPYGGPDIEVAVRRVVLGYRAVAACWVALLALIAWSGGRLPASLAAATSAGALGWALVTIGLDRRRPAALAAPAWIAVDIAVGAVAILGPVLVLERPVAIAGGFPFAVVLAAAWKRGYAGALVAAATLGTASALRSSRTEAADAALQAVANDYAFYLLGAAVVAWGIAVLYRNDGRRRAALEALGEERAHRLVAQERAETAAHLHDSVLQTLALVQRRSDIPAEVRSLARRQERELREWLGGGPQGRRATATLASAVQDVAEEIEAAYGLHVDVVVGGDTALGDAEKPVVAATREALTNAARHAGVDRVDVYVEARADAVAVYVRDRGRGFDPAGVPDDRRGLGESIIGRMQRAGGHAQVHAAPGAGVEVELVLPRGGRA